MGKLSTARVLRDLEASIWLGTVRAVPSFERQSEMNRMRMINVRSAGPLISKLRNSELARNRSSVSSMISSWDVSAVCPVSASRSDKPLEYTDWCRASDSCFDGQDGQISDLSHVWVLVE